MYISLFQFAIEIDQSAIPAPLLEVLEPAILIISIILSIFIVFFSLRKFARARYITPEKYHKVVMSVQLPKVGTGSERSGEKTLQQIQEEIAVTETIFGSIGGLRASRGLKSWFLGRQDDLSFEIVYEDEKIKFYIAIPSYLQEYVEQQIHGQYPDAHIEEIADYNIFQSKSVVLGNYLVFQKPYIFPIKTYKQLQSDPLNAVLNTFNKFDEQDGAAIQIIFRSSHKKWHTWGSRAVSKMHQGTKMSEAVSSTGGGFGNAFKGLTSVFKTSSKDGQLPETYKLSSKEEEAAKGIEEKTSKAGLDVNIRVLVASSNSSKAQMRLNDINNSFSQFNIYEFGNSFTTKLVGSLKRFVEDFIHRDFNEKASVLLNTEELATIFHFPLSFTEVSNIDWLSARKAPPPIGLPREGTLLGYNVYRGKRTEVYIKEADRRRHMYVIGMTGVGKSWFAEGIAIQDIHAGKGVCFIDPHGDAIDHILAHIPKERAEDVILFDPANADRAMSLNMLEYETEDQKLFVVDTILQVFDKLYDLKATGGPMFEQYMRNTLLLLMDDPDTGMTLADVPKVLADEDYRKLKLSRCKTKVVKDFWEKEAQKAGGEASLQNMVPYITSKLTPFIANDLMRPIISQQKSSFSFREAMDNEKIILVKLSKGKIGDLNANLLGMIMINKILMAALSRADMAEDDRKDFYLYIDEFQNFLTDSIETILSEARKYKLVLTMAHQYLGQLVKGGETKFKDAIFGNVGTKISFRIGVDDAEGMTREFAPTFTEYDFLNCPKYTTFAKILVDNANPPPFNMNTYPFSRFGEENVEQGKMIAELSFLKYGRDHATIEAEILEQEMKLTEFMKSSAEKTAIKKKSSIGSRSLRTKDSTAMPASASLGAKKALPTPPPISNAMPTATSTPQKPVAPRATLTPPVIPNTVVAKPIQNVNVEPKESEAQTASHVDTPSISNIPVASTKPNKLASRLSRRPRLSMAKPVENIDSVDDVNKGDSANQVNKTIQE